ncbi:hypothetical protein IV203_012313 [Nitzschia inconspicua]|uniref:Uncharacterized protein n=1 Tax=Nitzschia inconspicua TaxID=303405 RepID=A0A9K3KUC6_9STRA|nr:hypothetical protein IV203_012313 [Nitzschia inconspicua]
MQAFSCTSTPAILDEWFAALGLGDYSSNEKKAKQEDDQKTVDASDESVHYEFDDDEKQQQQQQPDESLPSTQRNSGSIVRVSCDPRKCPMSNGVCCDCCKCLHHRKCGDLKILPPTCDTPDCSERVCPQCMRCHHHCLCRCSTVRSEREGQRYRFGAVPATNGSLSNIVLQTRRAIGTSNTQNAPPPFTEETSSQDSSSLWGKCYDPYVQGDEETDEGITAYHNEDDQLGKNNGAVASGRTIPTMAASKTVDPMRRHTLNFEIVYNQIYNTPSTKRNHLSSFSGKPTYWNQQQTPKPRQGRVRQSWQHGARPKGAAALAEF